MDEQSLGTILRGYLEHSGQPQQAAAMAWLQRWSAAGGESRTPNTVTSRLNDLLADRPKGLRFFFDDLVATRLLFEVLGVPDAERELLQQRAEAARARTGAAPARLVIDATALTSRREQHERLFAQLRELLLDVPKLRPAVLVLNRSQYEALPLAVKEAYGDELVVRPVAPGEEVTAVVEEVLTDHCLLASTRLQGPFRRWLALHFDGARLLLEPPAGVQTFVQTGTLPGLPVVPPEHELAAALGIEPRGRLGPLDGCNRRRLMVELGVEDSATSRHPPRERLAWALELGVQATSTARERLEAELAALQQHVGLTAQPARPDELEATLARASRRPVQDVALRIGDELHLVNPVREVAPRPRLQVHRRSCREAALARLLAAIDGWTEDDWLADRRLERVIERLDPTGQERPLFQFARAWLLQPATLAPAAPTVNHGELSALTQLLAQEMPEASFRLGFHEPPPPQVWVCWKEALHQWGNYCSFEKIELNRPPFLLQAEETEVIRSQTPAQVHRFPPVGELLVRRQDQPVVINYLARTRLNPEAPPEVLIPLAADQTRNVEAWLDAIERSPWLGGQPASVDQAQRYLPEGKLLADWQPIPVQIEPAQWRAADLSLAELWLALRQSLQAPHLRLPDGTWLLQLIPGLAAEVRIRRHGAADDPVRASFRLPLQPGRGNCYSPIPDGFEQRLAARTECWQPPSPGCTPITVFAGWRLPTGVRLQGCGHVAEVTFRAAPLLGGNRGSEWPPQSAAAVQLIAQQEEEDWDD